MNKAEFSHAILGFFHIVVKDRKNPARFAAEDWTFGKGLFYDIDQPTITKTRIVNELYKLKTKKEWVSWLKRHAIWHERNKGLLEPHLDKLLGVVLNGKEKEKER